MWRSQHARKKRALHHTEVYKKSLIISENKMYLLWHINGSFRLEKPLKRRVNLLCRQATCEVKLRRHSSPLEPLERKMLHLFIWFPLGLYLWVFVHAYTTLCAHSFLGRHHCVAGQKAGSRGHWRREILGNSVFLEHMLMNVDVNRSCVLLALVTN